MKKSSSLKRCFKVHLPALLLLGNPLLSTHLEGYQASPQRIRMLYNSLKPNSVAQYLAFYELYPHTTEGQQALRQGWALIAPNTKPVSLLPSNPIIEAMVALVNKQPHSAAISLTQEQLAQIAELGKELPNRKLRGYAAKHEQQVLELESQDIDLARALFLSQLGDSPEALASMHSYEALIDLIALQILARLPKEASARQKIETINHFIFHEMGYRFPPQSVYAKEIDLYTFLPSVLDGRRGVCLGISLLYLALAQRLNLPLEIITPPGHIYVRYKDSQEIINIETTARGIDTDCDIYLSVDTFRLEQRQLKEAIGMAHFNQAALYLQSNAFDKALEAYDKAKNYLLEDHQLIELMGLCLILTGKTDEGKELLKKAMHMPDACSIKSNRAAEDYLAGLVDEEGLRALFIAVDEKRSSIIAKQRTLQQVVEKYPRFRDGLFALATTWIQLHRLNEALACLEKYHEIDSTDPKVEYYLTLLYMERYNYPKSWQHLKQTEQIVYAHTSHCKTLQYTRRELEHLSPENKLQ